MWVEDEGIALPLPRSFCLVQLERLGLVCKNFATAVVDDISSNTQQKALDYACVALKIYVDRLMIKKKAKKKQNSRKSSKRQHSPHDEIFKKIFKNKKYLIELLRVIFSHAKFAMFDLEGIIIKDSALIRSRGGELRTDIRVLVPLQDIEGVVIVLSIILEHKSYSDRDAVLQVMEYYIEECKARSKQRKRKKGEPYQLIIPVILLCCEDKNFEPPLDYLSWEFGNEEIPLELKDFEDDLPLLQCKVVNLRKLPQDDLWTKAMCSAIIIHAMGEVWSANDETVAFIVDRVRQLPPEDAWFLLIALMDYYKSADTGIEREDFDRVDRKRHPNLQEEDRLMPAIEFSLDKAEERGIRKGMQEGMQEGRQEVAMRLLQAGVDEETIRTAAQISVKELAALKRKLKN